MQIPRWDQSTDVIVIGSGFAGLAAAIEAAQSGCRVCVLEKRDFHGGNSWISGGAMAAVDIEMQQRHGIADSTQLMFEDMMKAGRTNNPLLVQLVCMHSFEVLQWLRQDLGVRFMDRLEQLGGHSVPRCHNVEEIQGRNIINKMLERAEQLNIDIRLNNCMEQLHQATDGTVTGVSCHSDTHGEYHIRATKAVILASGGFSGEAAANQQQENEPSTLLTSLGDSNADTLRIAERAGADMIDMEYLQMLPCASPDEEGRGVAPVFSSYVVFPYGFMVDPLSGQRFVNEWTDRKTRASAMLTCKTYPVGITDQQALETVGDMIFDHMDTTVTRRFESLKELADFHKIPLRSLERTLDTYNRYVEQRQDTDFNKPIPARAKPLKAPFYSVRLWPKAHSTMGGVRINTQAAVLSSSAQPIPRLFAAGEVTGGVHGMSRLGCCAITECLVFGRIAGKQAALLLGNEEMN